ncbi:CBS domain containing protein [Thiomonas sp. X19]|uniref:CBS domain-containing protein n=1 Tax=Thiomonas sp. X19 TaxID=1050370 RepID=UPI000B63EFC5|nr:CBS domain-containing protein [Thiomonas sp. X19]SCC92748.1 CBS domain containing protein [Thiomonas sp. X19]
MQVSDILRVKGGALFTVAPDTPLLEAARTMTQHDVGSLVVMRAGHLAGMLTFREVIAALAGARPGEAQVADVMLGEPVHCTPLTSLDELRRLMLESHTRYMPVMEGTTLLGVISFHDVARAVVQEQDFENRMLKAYIRDWPQDDAQTPSPSAGTPPTSATIQPLSRSI